ncbi:type II toxin-antitoxin system tRNA(fMet)-specific endonuclease VapC [Treponema saccharophilum]|uniref:type II toxin-antitoxin system tRNA(fMet)-specific endonuclease VapC n=1 Tax=Treponema saccharophilum TaxID=165 RepID=UPI00059378BF|nr:type II toxin-antitoxin system VapC family toxin [Treponema saccharophilum]
MKYFLDTNVIIDAIKNKSPCLKHHFEETYTTDIFVSSVVVAELEFGAAHSNYYSRNKALYEQFIKDFTIVPFEKRYCESYGELRQYLTKSGQVIGWNDMLIAATAIANSGILVTHNTAEFERIPNIQLEDWTK